MANVWGKKLKLSIFGESHGSAIGVVVGGLPPGEAIDFAEIDREMLRRAPGRDAFSTARQESDKVEILSGLYQGKTTGAPLCGLIRNTDARSREYDSKLRPGHADWTALLKYGGYADMRGGGHFSGRLTAPLVFAGSLAKQVLFRRGITIVCRIVRIGGIADEGTYLQGDQWEKIAGQNFPVWDVSAKARMMDEIVRAKDDGDSIGGIIEAAAFGLPGGLGDPFFDSMESVIASMIFSIPAVKGMEFGEGFRFADLRGSEANDELYVENGKIGAYTNHNGGILGGITNGMPLTVRVAIKPTPSIAKEQRTVDAATMQPVPLHIRGRHDPCIVPRAVPVIEAGVALSLLDCFLMEVTG